MTPEPELVDRYPDGMCPMCGARGERDHTPGCPKYHGWSRPVMQSGFEESAKRAGDKLRADASVHAADCWERLEREDDGAVCDKGAFCGGPEPDLPVRPCCDDPDIEGEVVQIAPARCLTCGAEQPFTPTESPLPVEQGSDLAALITSARWMEVAIRDALDLWATDDTTEGHAERMTDAICAARTAAYEWDKRARRMGVDWWNRNA